MAYLLITLCCALLVQWKGIETREVNASQNKSNSKKEWYASDDLQFLSRNAAHVSNPPPGILRVPWWTSFIFTIIEYFRQQRLPDRNHFGCLYMANVENLNEFNPNFHPRNSDGTPVVNNANPISPPNRNTFGNYVASRPTYVGNGMMHAERLLLNELHNLWNAFYNGYHQTPNFILLYSWIMPCSECTDAIIQAFQQPPFNNVRNLVIAYTTEGLLLPYMNWTINENSRNNLRNNDLLYWKQQCYRLNNFTIENTAAHETGQQMSSRIIDKTTNVRDTVIFEKMGPVEDNTDPQVCKLSDTFQGCLFTCLDISLCCFCIESNRDSMKAAMINELTMKCAISDFGKCTKGWIDQNIGDASRCIRKDEIQDQLEKCATGCYDKPLSNPYDPYKPYVYPGLLTVFSKLSEFQRPDLSRFCRDVRTEGFLCSKYTADSFTAGNSLCRSDNTCGYHGGVSYSWCYTDFSNNWDYCCTGPCSYGQGTSYLSCSSGNKWQYCGNAGSVDIQGRMCLPSFPCGMHQEIGKTSYYWCYVDINKNWDRCCRPGDTCSKKNESCNWCYTGYEIATERQNCKPYTKMKWEQ